MHILSRGEPKLRVDLEVLPRLDKPVEAAAGHRYYVTVDMKEAYFQVILEEASRDITTFTEVIGRGSRSFST